MSDRERLVEWPREIDLPRGWLHEARHGDRPVPRLGPHPMERQYEQMRNALDLGREVGEPEVCERHSIPVAPPPKNPRPRHLAAV